MMPVAARCKLTSPLCKLALHKKSFGHRRLSNSSGSIRSHSHLALAVCRENRTSPCRLRDLSVSVLKFALEKKHHGVALLVYDAQIAK